jgi:putative ABC transport system permease protein
MQDLRLAIRSLRKSPGFTLAAVLTLALGIGANTAIFSVVDRVLLRPTPVQSLDRMAVVWETDRQTGTTREPASVPDFLDFQRSGRSFAGLAALMAVEVNLGQAGEDPVRLAALRVTHGLLPMLGVQPIAGRPLAEPEERPGAADVALISESLWERSFGRDPAIIGRSVRLDERPVTVIGVVPEAGDFGVFQVLSAAAYARGFADRGDRARVDVWLPLRPDPDSLPRDTHPVILLGRLAPGASFAAAQDEMTRLAADLERAYPEENAGRGVNVMPLADVVLGPVRPALLVLLGAVAVVLLVACVNVANLLLVRGAARLRDVAVRTALGADRGRLARQFLAESLVITVLASTAGIALAYGALDVLLALAPPDLPRLDEVTLDLRVLAVTLGVSALVAAGFGLVPTLQAGGADVQALINQEGARASAGPGRGRLRRTLAIAEFALAVVLVAGAGLLIKSFWRLAQVDPGFRTAGVLKAEYQLPSTRYPVDFARWPDFKEIHAFDDAVLRRAAALPGVEAAALAGNHPLDPGFTNSFTIVGRETEAASWPEISIRRVTPGYFRTVGLGLVGGRLLEESDATAAPLVLVINQAAARRFFPDRSPLGQRIAFWGSQRTIVGVVEDERFQGIAEAAPIAVYSPLAQTPSVNGAGVLLVRTRGDVAGLGPALGRVIREVDPGLAVFGVEPLAHTVSRSLSKPRFTMLVLGMFAALALALAAIGIHGVISYGVVQRTREIGIRMALGARPGLVLRQVAREGLLLAGVGTLLGLVGSFAFGRVLRSLLFGISPVDPITYVGVTLFLAGVAVAASYAPARRAARVDPMVALRAE